MAHNTAHPLAGRTVQITDAGIGNPSLPAGEFIRIEDWYDRVNPGSRWSDRQTFAELNYELYNVEPNQLPRDDEVVYGKVDHLGYLVHVSQLGQVIE